MKIWAISDTHCIHNNLIIPDNVDMVIHSGDCSNDRNRFVNSNEVLNFMKWYQSLNIKYKVYIPGNHDVSFSDSLFFKDSFEGVQILIHDSVNIQGINIFGSPYTPSYGNGWGYNKARHKIKEVWDTLPNEIDILVTHGPAGGILDLTKDNNGNNFVQVGCKSLYNKIQKIKPKYHIFGHIHDETNVNNFGLYMRDNTKYMNASCYINSSKSINNGITFIY